MNPTPVAADEYKRTTCPLCLGPLQQRRVGQWCPRCRGWLYPEVRGGALVYRLWQGRI